MIKRVKIITSFLSLILVGIFSQNLVQANLNQADFSNEEAVIIGAGSDTIHPITVDDLEEIVIEEVVLVEKESTDVEEIADEEEQVEEEVQEEVEESVEEQEIDSEEIFEETTEENLEEVNEEILEEVQTFQLLEEEIVVEPEFVEEIQTIVTYSGYAVENEIEYHTTGSTGSIAGDIAAGATVTILSGEGTVELNGATTSSQLLFSGGNIKVNGNGTTLSKQIVISNATVELDSITVSNPSYAVTLNSNTNLIVGENALLEGTGSYTSAIITNEYTTNINITVNGTVKSTQQGIGVEKGSVVDSVIINGTVYCYGNFGAISTTFGGTIRSLHLTESGYIENLPGLAIYSSENGSRIDSIVLDGTIKARVAMTVGRSDYYTNPSHGTTIVNGSIEVTSSAFYVYGKMEEIIFSPQSKVNVLASNQGVVFANEYANLGRVEFSGWMASKYIVVLLKSGGYFGEVLFNTNEIHLNEKFSNFILVYNAGTIDQITFTEDSKVIGDVIRAFYLLGNSKINQVNLNNLILDTTLIDEDGYSFYSQPVNTMGTISIDDSILFGKAVDINPNLSSDYIHIVPEIELSNKTQLVDGVQFDVLVPNMDSRITTLKVAIMNSNYEILSTEYINPHGDTIVIPHSVVEDFYVANYALDDQGNKVMLTSAKSEIQEYEIPPLDLDIDVDAEDVTYYVGTAVDEIQLLSDAGARVDVSVPTTRAEAVALTADITLVDFDTVGSYPATIKATHVSGIETSTDIVVNVIDVEEELPPVIDPEEPPVVNPEQPAVETPPANVVNTGVSVNMTPYIVIGFGAILIITYLFFKKKKV